MGLAKSKGWFSLTFPAVVALPTRFRPWESHLRGARGAGIRQKARASRWEKKFKRRQKKEKKKKQENQRREKKKTTTSGEELKTSLMQSVVRRAERLETLVLSSSSDDERRAHHHLSYLASPPPLIYLSNFLRSRAPRSSSISVQSQPFAWFCHALFV